MKRMEDKQAMLFIPKVANVRISSWQDLRLSGIRQVQEVVNEGKM